ncbi:unnamed protein product [Rhizophagus irregularis]|nr:unnamed protein product [Rhizophagus irregularis]
MMKSIILVENYNVDNINEGEENDDVNNMDEEENDDVNEGEENDDVNNMDGEENDDVNEGEENDDVDNMDEEENDDVDEGEENDDVEDFFASPKIDNDNEEAFIVESLRTQRNENNIYSDIYDGKVWKNFPFDGSTFFTTETATTHLGLLLNLDWFQPFSYTQHSTGAIYASICNLPRSERNKPENIIYLGFLPGPKEAGLERINHYLAPIVDELLELWKGWKVPKTHQFSNGLEIKVALIVGSSDTPATRKLFGHGSAVMKCYRCDKRTTYSEEFRKTHYGGMQDYNEWVTKPADLLLHRQYAHECTKQNG